MCKSSLHITISSFILFLHSVVFTIMMLTSLPCLWVSHSLDYVLDFTDLVGCQQYSLLSWEDIAVGKVTFSEWSLSFIFSAVCSYMRKLHCLIYGNDTYILEDIQNLSGHGPGQLALGSPAWAGRLDQMTSRGPFPPQPFCDSVMGTILFWHAKTCFPYV